jgi:hypothetical protein
MSFSWTLSGRGWANCIVADDQSQAEATASYITAAPEDLLVAVTRLVLGETETRAQFDAEPTAYRWRFHRGDNDVWVQLLRLPNGRRHDNAGTEIWSSWQTLDTLARAVIRGFEEVAHTHGESGYHGKWGSPFPRAELEQLRTAWNQAKRPRTSETAT